MIKQIIKWFTEPIKYTPQEFMNELETLTEMGLNGDSRSVQSDWGYKFFEYLVDEHPKLHFHYDWDTKKATFRKKRRDEY